MQETSGLQPPNSTFRSIHYGNWRRATPFHYDANGATMASEGPDVFSRSRRQVDNVATEGVLMRRVRFHSVLLLLLVLACAKEEPASERSTVNGPPVQGGTAIIAMGQEPETLMPYAHRSDASSVVLGFLFRMLAETEASFGDYSPDLATSWEWSADHKTLTMFLNPDVRWSDGEPLTAADVVFTWKVASDDRVGWGARHWKKTIRECARVDSHTVRFTFDEVFPDQFRFAKEGFVLPQHLLADVPLEEWASADFGRNPVGTGPFRLHAWEKGQRIILVPNEHYHIPQQPYLDRVVIEFIPDAAVRIQKLRAGLVDFVADVNTRDAAALRDAWQAGRSDVRLVSTRGRLYDYIGYNQRDPLFESVRVRKALTMAIDRKAIIDALCYGFAEVFESPVLPILWAYDDSLEPTPYDPQQARRLLAQEGWEDTDGDGWIDREGRPFEFTVLVNQDNKLRTDALVPVQRDWQNIGVKTTIQRIESSTGLDMRTQGRFQAYYGGWRSSITVDFHNIWGCDASPRLNSIGYCNPRVDSLNALATQMLDRQESLPLFLEAQRLIRQDHPYTWMYYIHSLVGVNRRLQDVLIDARGPLLNPEEWWIPEDLQRP
jgi:peptide/nickel transport system substrate-binding protein